ncbi:peptidoglycan D,D-transpeptidase FtsI family protein [Falsirhodobacter algicola]|uniref:Penicillin-binding protein 2 n=1 Tax=Falsirhodobacter algicola TaxID=2692330 RepID=A0A8J8SK56_9RHOB|nr:penicillin-binding protein 2 [Falsirhodobacter algicola]QUS35007.1 penicillin-binding protein 2 [Falsirhodobacter algicola]
MIRTPLRPLARILQARLNGQNPDVIERENLRLRHEAARDKARSRAEVRLLFLGLSFFMMFMVIGARMGLLASTEPSEPRSALPGHEISANRADITDRDGRILATNIQTYALYAHPQDMIDPMHVAEELVRIFPDMDEDALKRRFTDGRKFMWIRRKLSPEQMQAVHDIGDPGLLFGPREMRLYPNGHLASHILGGTSFGAEGVASAEVIGTAGIERAMDARLRDPAQSEPLQLSIDMTVQAAITEVLNTGMKMMNSKGAAAVLMDVHTGEVISLVSLPDFDPNDRPAPILTGDPGDSPLFNRAVQGVYELGSTFKIFTVANAMQLGLVGPDTIIDGNAPLIWGKYRIKEFQNHNYGIQTVTQVIENSSNVGTARIALEVGAQRQQAFMRSLGLFDPTPVELVEAPGAKPIVPARWPEIVTITTSYGHGIAASPMHLAAAYSTIANGGYRVTPTLLHRTQTPEMPQVVATDVAHKAVDMLRMVVTNGTASFADVPGYQVGGKTGTADKPDPQGGYYNDKVVNTFASVFPTSAPQYALVVTLDEPSDNTLSVPRRSAGWTAVPVAAEIIRRVAPLMGLRPIETQPAAQLRADLPEE